MKRQKQQDAEAQRLKKVQDDLQKTYGQIDSASGKTKARDNESSEDVQKKLNRMF